MNCQYTADVVFCPSVQVFSVIQVLANFLSAPLASGVDADVVGWPCVAFDIDPSVVKVSLFFIHLVVRRILT